MSFRNIMDTNKPFTSEEFKNIYAKVPRLCVDIVIKTDRGILMTLRDIEPYKGLWHIPGGTVLYGETIDAAVKRIARQELGIETEVLNLLGYLEFPSEKKLKGWGQPIALQMLCTIRSGEIKLDNQASEFRFFQNLIPDNTVEEHKMVFDKLLNT